MLRLVSYACAAMLALSACAASASQSPDAPRRPASTADPQASADPSSSATAPVVVFLGDSYTAGITGTPPEETYAAVTARRLDWQVIITGYRGTGFVAQGRVGKTFAMLDREEVAWRPAPDMMIVAGGHNDWLQNPREVAAAARALLSGIKHRWPATTLVLTGPMWGGDPRVKALHVRDALKGVADELGIPFIDPLQERWITGDVRRRTGTARRYIRPDGVHPNEAGNQYFADRLVADLRGLGLTEPRLGRTG